MMQFINDNVRVIGFEKRDHFTQALNFQAKVHVPRASLYSSPSTEEIQH